MRPYASVSGLLSTVTELVRFAIDPDIQEIYSDPYTFQPGHSMCHEFGLK